MKLQLQKVAVRGEKLYKVLHISGIKSFYDKMPKTLRDEPFQLHYWKPWKSGNPQGSPISPFAEVQWDAINKDNGAKIIKKLRISEGELYSEEHIERFIEKATICIEIGKRAEEEARKLEETWCGEVEFIVR